MIEQPWWIVLANRLDEIKRERALLEEPEPELVFDIHDQATLRAT